MHTMTTADQLPELLHASFPVQPLPGFFWVDGGEQPVGDIPEELLKRIVHRPWVDITMRDWTMTGAHASIARAYLDPTAFRYYLPSLLIGALREIGYFDWALECLLPAGRKRRPIGKWWADFWIGFSEQQREAVCAYLKGVRSMLGDSVDPVNQQLLDEAEAIWVSSAR
jgi:hypothetical protein